MGRVALADRTLSLCALYATETYHPDPVGTADVSPGAMPDSEGPRACRACKRGVNRAPEIWGGGVGKGAQ